MKRLLFCLLWLVTAAAAQTPPQTTNLGLYEPAHGSFNWDTWYNANWVAIDTKLGPSFTQGLVTLSANNVFTGSNTFSNPGVFTGGPNLYTQSLLNGCSPGAEFNTINASTAFTDTASVCVIVPAAANQTQTNAIAGYVENQSGAGSPGVAGYFQAIGTVNPNAHIFAINTEVSDTATVPSINMFSAEYDTQVHNASSVPIGTASYGLFYAQPGNGIAMDVAVGQLGACATCYWPYGLRFVTGATIAPNPSGGAVFFNPLLAGVNHASQGITFAANDPSSGINYAFLSETAAGALLVSNSKAVTGFGWTDGTFGSSQISGASACETSYGITTLSGASTSTGLSCLPANSIIDAVVYRITTTITTATSFTIGDSGSATRYCGTQSTLTAGTTGLCLAAGYYLNSGALAVKVTPSTSPGAGAMRIIVYYHTWTAPTS